MPSSISPIPMVITAVGHGNTLRRGFIQRQVCHALVGVGILPEFVEVVTVLERFVLVLKVKLCFLR